MNVTQQVFVWMDEAQDVGAFANKYSPIDLPEEGEPNRVWTLYQNLDKDNEPEFPFEPKHLKNAFLEDKVHDWNVRGGKFHFATRVTDTGVWLLFEYDGVLKC